MLYELVLLLLIANECNVRVSIIGFGLYNPELTHLEKSKNIIAVHRLEK